MAKEKTTYSQSKLKKNITNINESQKKLASALNSMSANLTAMMKGDSDGPYWNGNKAANFYKSAKSNLDHNIDDYQRSYNRLSKLAIEYEKLAGK